MNHAPRNPVTVTHTSRRRFRLISLGSGPTVAKPPAAAALDVPTAGVPTYLVASPPPAADVFDASGFGLAESVSGPAMRNQSEAAPAGVGYRHRIPWCVVHRLPSFFSSPYAFRASHRFQDWLRLRLRPRRGYQVAAEISHMGGPHSGSCLCNLRALHASRLHARLEGQRKQVQVPLPR